MTGRTETYLDYNATAPVRPAVIEVVASALGQVGNPSSVHQAGRRARGLVEKARAEVANLVGASSKSVIFTGGGTEANNLALRGVKASRLVISAVEHDSVRGLVDVWQGPVDILPVDRRGQPELEELERLLSNGEGTALVSVMLVNNETGVIMPVGDITAIAHRHGALVHTDAVQAAGKIPVDFRGLGVDLMTLSGHKFGGPQGVGALLIRDKLVLEPLIRGGGQELRRRSGTENVPGIAGFGEAARLAREGLEEMGRIEALRRALEAGIHEQVPDAVIFGADSPRAATTVCVAVPGVSSETQVMALDLEGICVSAGSACSSGKVTPSHVLEAMGADKDTARSAIRVSLGWASTREDIDRFLEVWPRAIARALKTTRAEQRAS